LEPWNEGVKITGGDKDRQSRNLTDANHEANSSSQQKMAVPITENRCRSRSISRRIDTQFALEGCGTAECEHPSSLAASSARFNGSFGAIGRRSWAKSLYNFCTISARILRF
jgi:hypothetical protein